MSSLRHRFVAGAGALVVGAVSALVLPGAVGVAAADVCASNVDATAYAAQAFRAAGLTTDHAEAVAYLEGATVQISPDTLKGWPDADGRISARATGLATAALSYADTANAPALIEDGHTLLTDVQQPTGAIHTYYNAESPEPPRAATVGAILGLAQADLTAGTNGGGYPVEVTAASDWLESQLSGGSDDVLDHFKTADLSDWDLELTASASYAWAAAEHNTTETTNVLNWLARHAPSYITNTRPSDSSPEQWDSTDERDRNVRALAWLILVADVHDVSATSFGPMEIDLVAALSQLQSEDGWFDDKPALSRSAVTQALAVLALHTQGIDIADGAQALAEQQCSDGGLSAAALPVIEPEIPVEPTDPVEIDPPSIDLAITSVEPGETITIPISGFQPNEQIRIELHSTPIVLGYFNVDNRGSVAATVTVPASTPLGEHTLWVYGEGSGFSASKIITVKPRSTGGITQVVVEPSSQQAAPAVTTTRPAPTTPRLSATGTSTGLMVLGAVGGAVLIAGAGLLLVSRRMSSREH